MKDNAITVTSNYVKGIQTSQKRMKIFEYLKSYVTTNEFVFLQDFNIIFDSFLEVQGCNQF